MEVKTIKKTSKNRYRFLQYFSIFLLFIFIQIVGQEIPIHLKKPTIDDDSKFTSAGNIGITISNFGTFGDGFVQQAPIDQPSCEYPKGSGIEHLFVGGLWVGGVTTSGTHVSTAAFNTPRLSGGGSVNFEFTNTANPTDIVTERSSIPENKYFSYNAISHQDFIADFSDTNTIVPGTSVQIPYHVPMGVSAHLETYAWNFPFADAFVIFNYTINNVWDDVLTDVYVALWADLVVRNTNITPPRVGSPFYLHAGVGYIDDDSTKLVYCYDYNGDPGFTDSYVAIALLGADALENDAKYNGKMYHNWWLFSGGDADEDRAPRDEGSRYQRMRESISENYFRQNVFQSPGNRMSLISTGPFETIPPDSSINVVFAFICGKKYGINPSTVDDDIAKQNLIENTRWAYRAYNGEDSNRNGILDYMGTDSTEDINGNGKLDRYILPTPPAAPYIKVIPGNKQVTLLWDDRAEESIDLITKKSDFEGYRIYRSFVGADRSSEGITSNMGLIAEFDNMDGLFYDTGLDSIILQEPVSEIVTLEGIADTIHYKYRYVVDNLHNGWQYAFSVTAFDSGDIKLKLKSLESSKLQNMNIVSPGTPARLKGEVDLPEIRILFDDIVDFSGDSIGDQDTILQNTEISTIYQYIDFSKLRSESFKSGKLIVTLENNMDFEIGNPFTISILNIDSTYLYNNSGNPISFTWEEIIIPNSITKKNMSMENMTIPEKVLMEISGYICGENDFIYIYSESIRKSSFSVKFDTEKLKIVNSKKNKVGVYPNPYRSNALWDGNFERERKLFFYNLPENCEVRIYTLAGDIVDRFIHHGMEYNGSDIKWYEQFSLGNTVFSGGEHAWDLVSKYDQAIATGLYIYTVKDLDDGSVFKGKFLVIK